jgi:inosine-uridine nucleoside N-ribohydrolase
MRKIILLLFVLLMAKTSPVPAQPLRVIFDTDMGNDIDDALALAMLHAFASRGEVELLAVTLTKANGWAAPYVDVVNTFYGRDDIPIGVVRDGKTPDDHAMIRVPAERTQPDGSPVYPHDLTDGRRAPEAVDLLRRTLAAQPDSSVTMIQVGFSTNLARLLDTPGDAHSPLTGRELVARKVRLLSIMAGAFPAGAPEFNVRVDLPAATQLFAAWPTPLVASGFEVGESILYPAASIERHYGYVAHHPIADAYRHYLPMPYDRPTWDLTSVLYAVRPDEGYFGLSEPGQITVDEEGRTRLEPAAGGMHRYLTVDDAQRRRALEAFVYLASEPPSAR